MKRIMLHADDFGAGPQISDNILDCCREGALTDISVLPNTPHFNETLDAFFKGGCGQRLTIHFNLAEGPGLSKSARNGLLADKRGMFCLSFAQVLRMSFSADRYALRHQIKDELRAQLALYLKGLQDRGITWGEARRLRVDSHQHYHMIPLVLDTLLEVIKEEQCTITYIRIPAEPLLPFLMHPELYATYRPINIVKSLVLNGLSVADSPMLAPYRKKSALFFGIMLSGNMDKKRVKLLLPDFLKMARSRGCALEVLAHPGGVDGTDDPEEFPDPENRECVSFYSSRGRKNEKNMLLSLARRRA